MKFHLVIGIICVLIAVMVSGCTQQPAQPAATTPPTTAAPATPPVPQTASPDAKTMLTNGTWSAGSFIKDGAPVSLVPGTTITASFRATGKVDGSSGCNSYTASYNITGNAISFGPAISTMMYCGDPGVMDQESMYLGMLQNASAFSVTATGLQISDAGGKNQVIYQKYRPPSLTGSWKLDSIGQNNTVSRIIPGTNITAVFAADGNLTGNAGCNSYNTRFTVEGESLSVSSPIATTRMFCGDPGVMDQESMYLRLLQNATKYSVTKNQLTLMDANGKATLFFMAA